MTTAPLTVVTFKWEPAEGRAKFRSEHVNTLARMVRRNYPHPHRFACVTDDAAGLDPELVEVIPLWPDHGRLQNPHGPSYPSCYRRLKLFAPEMADLLGPRFVCMDLDCVVTGDLAPLWHRPEDFVMWGGTNPSTHYNGSMILMNAGARPQVWEDFHPVRSPRLAREARQFGSDQGWISYRLGKGEATWTPEDGVLGWVNHLANGTRRPPPGTRLVFFNGKRFNPWDAQPMLLRWVRRHYQ